MSDPGPPVGESYRAPRRLYVTQDWSRVVEEGDPAAAFLLAGKGGEVSEADVRRYKLRELPDPAAPAAKMVAGPPENKAQEAPEKPAQATPSGRRRTSAKDGA